MDVSSPNSLFVPPASPFLGNWLIFGSFPSFPFWVFFSHHRTFPREAHGGCSQTYVALTHLILSHCSLIAALKLHLSAIVVQQRSWNIVAEKDKHLDSHGLFRLRSSLAKSLGSKSLRARTKVVQAAECQPGLQSSHSLTRERIWF